MLDLNAEHEVLSFIVGDTKAGTKMGKLQLKNLDSNVILNCIMWEEALNRTEPKIFRTGNIVKIITATFNEKFNNCLVNNLKLVKEAICGLGENNREKYYQKVISTLDEFSNEDLKNFVFEILDKNKELIKIAPAAKTMHHNYTGGLLVHICECIDFALLLHPKLNNKVNKDELLSACILHDIGKIYEYKIDLETGYVDYLDEFRKEWITHSQYGFTLCMSAGFKNVAKMIAAHHGRADWGAMIDLGERDLEPFYYIVHHIDDLSAKFGKISVNDIEDEAD